MPQTPDLSQVFADIDTEVSALERAVQRDAAPPLSETVNLALQIAKRLLRAYAGGRGQDQPTAADALASEDILEVFKGFVKGDPSLNAVRDNIRELVYYRNCLDSNREDALPKKPAAMAAHTLRHIYLYLRTRAIQEHRIDAV